MEKGRNIGEYEHLSVECDSFQEGVLIAGDQIEEISSRKDLVLVVVEGSSQKVGKTTLGNAIGRRMVNRGMHVIHCGRLLLGAALTSWMMSRRFSEAAKKGLVILQEGETSMIPSNQVEEYRTMKEDRIITHDIRKYLEMAGFGNCGVDLWLTIYTPEKPLFMPKDGNERLVSPGDITICNRGSVNDE